MNSQNLKLEFANLIGISKDSFIDCKDQFACYGWLMVELDGSVKLSSIDKPVTIIEAAKVDSVSSRGEQTAIICKTTYTGIPAPGSKFKMVNKDGIESVSLNLFYIIDNPTILSADFTYGVANLETKSAVGNASISAYVYVCHESSTSETFWKASRSYQMMSAVYAAHHCLPKESIYWRNLNVQFLYINSYVPVKIK